jgi:diketogulonate reductase-like aldo/keto reductase
LADVVITTKISRDQLSGADAAANVKKAVANETTLLGKKPDVVLLHFPGTANTNVASPLHKQARLAAWRQLLAEKAAGTVTGLVGVSNFTVAHLEEFRAAGLALPSVCQDECHPYCRQLQLRAYCEQHKIVFQPYTSLGRSLVPPKSLYGNLEYPADPKIHPRVADDKTVKEVAKTLGVSPELLLLRYSIETTGHAIPKMSTEAHIDENIKAVDDALWAELAKKQPEWVKALDEIKVPLKDKDTVRYAYQPAQLAIR